jgi:hypothetical protein
MLIADLIHSCSNEKVAQAAVACIGGHFADRVRRVAGRNGLNVGRFVAIVVRNFACRANDEARAALSTKVAGADQPLLNGLRHVVEPALEDSAFFFDDAASGFGAGASIGANWISLGLH